MNSYPDDDTRLISLVAACYLMALMSGQLSKNKRGNMRRALIEAIKHTGVSDKEIQGLIEQQDRMSKQ